MGILFCQSFSMVNFSVYLRVLPTESFNGILHCLPARVVGEVVGDRVPISFSLCVWQLCLGGCVTCVTDTISLAPSSPCIWNCTRGRPSVRCVAWSVAWCTIYVATYEDTTDLAANRLINFSTSDRICPSDLLTTSLLPLLTFFSDAVRPLLFLVMFFS